VAVSDERIARGEARGESFSTFVHAAVKIKE
jgi:hypothetical protein